MSADIPLVPSTLTVSRAENARARAIVRAELEHRMAGPRPKPLEGARCVGLTALMFDVGRVADAKAVCERCPVSVECLERAVAREERFGVWASVNFADRRERRAARERGAA
jgi:WhiB family redox-sensing transcriptional regulator